jgi:hypothetical protein
VSAAEYFQWHSEKTGPNSPTERKRLFPSFRLTRGDDITGLRMNFNGRDYKLINEAAFRAAATCPLVLRGTLGEVEFDRDEFLQLALSFAEPEGNG